MKMKDGVKNILVYITLSIVMIVFMTFICISITTKLEWFVSQEHTIRKTHESLNDTQYDLCNYLVKIKNEGIDEEDGDVMLEYRDGLINNYEYLTDTLQDLVSEYNEEYDKLSFLYKMILGQVFIGNMEGYLHG